MTSPTRPAMPGRQPAPKHFELVVFDCDGVLVDSEVIAVRVDQRVLAAGMHVPAYAGGVTPAHRLAGPGTRVFTDMRELPVAAGRPG